MITAQEQRDQDYWQGYWRGRSGQPRALSPTLSYLRGYQNGVQDAAVKQPEASNA